MTPYAIVWACTDQRLKAIAPFYGTNPRPLDAVARICPVVGSYPGRDFTARSGRRLEAALQRYGVPHDIKVYPGAQLQPGILTAVLSGISHAL